MILLGLILTIFLGWYIVKIISRNNLTFSERISLSFTIGIGLLTLMMFYMSIGGFRISQRNIILTFVAVFMLLFAINRSILFELFKFVMSFRQFSLRTFVKKTLFSYKILEIVLFLIISLLPIASLIITFYWPVSAWDSLTLYDFRGKLFANSISVYDIVKVTEYAPYYFVYPFFTSLAHTFVYLFKWYNPQFIYSFFYIALLLIFYSSMKNYCSRLMTLLLTLLLAITDPLFSHSTAAYTNFPYTFYYVISTIYLIRWIQKQENYLIVISGILLGLSYWTRSMEPFWISNLFILVWYSVKKKKFLAPLMSIIIFFIIRESWQIYFNKMIVEIIKPDLLANSVIPPTIKELLAAFSVERAVIILKFIELYVVRSWGFIFTVFVLLFLLNLANKQVKKDFYPLINILLLDVLFIILGTYFMSVRYNWWTEVPGSASRMAMFFPPLFIFYISTTSLIKNININEIVHYIWEKIYSHPELIKKVIEKTF